MTAKMTAILSDGGNPKRTLADPNSGLFILDERRRTLADARNAVFKTAGSRLVAG